MIWNRLVQTVVRQTFDRRGVFAHLLVPSREMHADLFGQYRFHMDLSLGRLQKILFLKPENYELETQEAIRERLRPGMIALDIGANSGYFSLLMADRVGERGKVYSFEPMPVSFELLKRNISENRLSQIVALPLALSDKSGTATLHLHPTNDGAHSLGQLAVGKNSVMVETDSLDHFLQSRGIPSVDLIKIDVEGAEPMVFAGAQNLLARPNAPDILCEVSDFNQRQTGGSERALREMLYEKGYRAYLLEDGGREIRREEPVRGLVNILFSKRR